MLRNLINPMSNPIRNNKSMAHPNTLLDPPEAMLAINAIRTMLLCVEEWSRRGDSNSRPLLLTKILEKQAA